MPSFKPKSVKQIVVCEKSATTLDGKHTEMLKKFDNNEKERDDALEFYMKRCHQLETENKDLKGSTKNTNVAINNGQTVITTGGGQTPHVLDAGNSLDLPLFMTA